MAKTAAPAPRPKGLKLLRIALQSRKAATMLAEDVIEHARGLGFGA